MAIMVTCSAKTERARRLRRETEEGKSDKRALPGLSGERRAAVNGALDTQ